MLEHRTISSFSWRDVHERLVSEGRSKRAKSKGPFYDALLCCFKPHHYVCPAANMQLPLFISLQMAVFLPLSSTHLPWARSGLEGLDILSSALSNMKAFSSQGVDVLSIIVLLSTIFQFLFVYSVYLDTFVHQYTRSLDSIVHLRISRFRLEI